MIKINWHIQQICPDTRQNPKTGSFVPWERYGDKVLRNGFGPLQKKQILTVVPGKILAVSMG